MFGSFQFGKVSKCMVKTKGIITVEFVMQRNLLWPLLVDLLPMLLMALIGHLTFHIKPESFDTAVQVLIATMLVLTTQ